MLATKAIGRMLKMRMALRVQLFGDALAPKTASGRGSDPEKLAGEVFRKLEREQK